MVFNLKEIDWSFIDLSVIKGFFMGLCIVFLLMFIINGIEDYQDDIFWTSERPSIIYGVGSLISLILVFVINKKIKTNNNL